MSKCKHLLDPRQHGFLQNKSCATQLVDFCDSLALSLNENIRTDVIYFDFAKAFDSVNHDLILYKLKNLYSIGGLLLNFVKNYLKGRKQSVVIEGFTSSPLPVISGVPQGSILGPTLFVLFLNDIVSEIDHDTNILMYADDTKIWRQMKPLQDHLALQKNIDCLFDWAVRNKMKFHPTKCKVLMVSKFNSPLVDVLPCTQFFYSMGFEVLDYVNSEKDLGILVNRTLNFTEHAKMLYSRANQRFGLMKRTCHFVNDQNKRRILYLTMVRSIFEHCPIIWRPSSNTIVNRLESIQKRAFKWIKQDMSLSYSSNDLLYYIHCKQLNILPIKFRFDFHDLKFLHLIINNFSCVKLPPYISFYNGTTRLRSCHLDYLSLVSCKSPTGQVSYNPSRGGFRHSYFYRTHLMWNLLPLSLRQIIGPSAFKVNLTDYIWKELVRVDHLSESNLSENDISDSED